MDDPKKYFNNKDYVTKIVGSEEEEATANKDKIDALIELLTLSENKDFREEALVTLKREKGGDLLLTAIEEATAHKHVLVAACWESEINFNTHLPFFINLALDSDYLVSLEAITVIGTMEPPFDKNNVKQSIQKVKAEQKKLNSERVVLLNDLINTLEGFNL